MNVDLTKEDLISLVKGQPPYYNIFDNYLVKRCGNYVGGFTDDWVWNSDQLKKLSEGDLWLLYVTCRDSWK